MEDKARWTRDIEHLLKGDERSSVESIEYMTAEGGALYGETVRIVFEGGYTVDINVNCNSLGAMLKEIVFEVYGGGARGAYYRGFPEQEGNHV